MDKKIVGKYLAVLLLILILVVLFINYKNNQSDITNKINSFQDVAANKENNTIELELMDDYISVINTEKIEVNIRYRKIHDNPNQIYLDLYKHKVNDNLEKFYPNIRKNNFSKLAIVHQDLKPESHVTNVVVEKIPNKDNIIDAEITIINEKDENKLLKSGINTINKGDIINIKFKPLPAFQNVLFNKNELKKFFMVLNFSLSKEQFDYESLILKSSPIELKFKKDIYYSLGLVLTDKNDKIIKKYLSRKHKDKSLVVYSDDIGKNELHNIELLNNTDELKDNIQWDSQSNNQGYLIRSLNDDNKMYYKIDDEGNVNLVYSKMPFDLLNFERTNTGLYNISKVKDNIYANRDFKFIIERDEYGRFKNNITNQLEEAGNFDIKVNKDDIKNIQTLGDYIDNAIQKSIPTEDAGIINYSYLQRGFTIDDIKMEHINGAVLSTDGSKHLPHVCNHNDKIITVQFSNLTKESEFENKFIIDHKNNQSVSEFYIYIKQDGKTTIDLSDINIKYSRPYDISNNVDNEDKSDSFENSSSFVSGRILPLIDRGHFLPDIDKSKGYNKNRFIYYGIGSTDGIVEPYDIATNKYKHELHEGQKIINKNNTRYIHVIREHQPVSIRALQLERLLISIPVNLVNFNEDDTYSLSKEIQINVINDKLYPGETIENYQTIFDQGTILQQLNSCSESVILNNLNKILLVEKDNVYDIISLNHPDYQKIKFGKCDNIMNRDNDIKDMRRANNFSKSILDNLVKKSGDILSRRSFELSNIQAQESSLLHQDFIKDYHNYEKNSLIDTNPYSKMDETVNYYEIKGREGFQDSIIKMTSVNNYFGTYIIYPGQFILLDNLEVQVDNKYIGFIEKGIPIIKFRHDNVLSIYSPFESFQGIKFRIVAFDKMVHNTSTTNLEKLFYNTGLRTPNFIYISKHDTQMKNGDIKSIYKLSNREYATLFQMKKIK